MVVCRNTFLKGMVMLRPDLMLNGPWGLGGRQTPCRGNMYSPPVSEDKVRWPFIAPCWWGSKQTSTLTSDPNWKPGETARLLSTTNSGQSVFRGDRTKHHVMTRKSCILLSTLQLNFKTCPLFIKHRSGLEFSYLAGVLGFVAGVVDEFNKDHVAAAQRCLEVDVFFRQRGQSPETQIVVKIAQLIIEQGQLSGNLAWLKRKVLKAQRTLKRDKHKRCQLEPMSSTFYFSGSAVSMHLGLSWDCKLSRSADVSAFTFRREADSRGQRVLHVNSSRGYPTDNWLQINCGQDARRLDFEVDEVEQVLSCQLVTKCHLTRNNERWCESKTAYTPTCWQKCVCSNLGVVISLSVCKERHGVIPRGQSRDFNVLLSLQGHASVRFIRLYDLEKHAEPEKSQKHSQLYCKPVKEGKLVLTNYNGGRTQICCSHKFFKFPKLRRFWKTNSSPLFCLILHTHKCKFLFLFYRCSLESQLLTASTSQWLVLAGSSCTMMPSAFGGSADPCRE